MGHERCAESYRVAKTQELQVVFRKRATNYGSFAENDL